LAHLRTDAAVNHMTSGGKLSVLPLLSSSLLLLSASPGLDVIEPDISVAATSDRCVLMRRSKFDQTTHVPVLNLAVQATTERRQDTTFGRQIALPAQLKLEAFEMMHSLSNR
jgi:hypothetical protein